jgi:energy-coupling factor transporter ATP-binding protein EcfA2
MITISNLWFTYPGTDQPVLKGINVQIPDGEFCLVMGSSGSGKSTLLRCLNGLVPHFSGGQLAGQISVNGVDPVSVSPSEMSQMVGFVFQDPEAQFVVDRVEDEIAFSLENMAFPRDEMEARVGEVLELLELANLRTRRLETLSGGEIQRTAIAAAVCLKPSILVLDEPTSQLDPQGAEEVLQALVKLKQHLGLTIVLAEHRLERVLPHVGEIIYLSEKYPAGLIGNPDKVLREVELNPPLVSLAKQFGWDPIPLTIEAARKYAQHSLKNHKIHPASASHKRVDRQGATRPPYIEASAVKVNYGQIQAVRGVDINLYPGEITVMMGPNGAGKSSFLRALVGLNHLEGGTILVDGRNNDGRSVAEICQQVGYLPQNPNALLFADTVLEELLITLHNHGLDPAGNNYQPRMLLKRLGLEDKADRYPRDLSTGERQRVALGAILVTHPGALLLDEPTRGLDYAAKLTLLNLLRTWRDEGMTILMVTHDVELAVQAADRVILMEKGLISADGKPWEVLTQSPAFAPQVLKIFPDQGWLTLEDVIGAKYASEH